MDGDAVGIVGGGGPWTGGPSRSPGRRRPRRAGIRSILPGAEDRVDVHSPTNAPWRGVALLNMFRAGSLVLVGTGFLSEPDVVVTARHNLTSVAYDSAGAWVGYDARANPGVVPSTIAAYATHRDLDLAVLILATGHPTAFRLGGDLPPDGSGLELAGYSMPYADGTARMSRASGPVRGEAGGSITYAISTREGDSGAPVFTTVGGVPRAVAVHTEAASLPHLGNGGVRLTPQVVADLAVMVNWARAQIGGSR